MKDYRPKPKSAPEIPTEPVPPPSKPVEPVPLTPGVDSKRRLVNTRAQKKNVDNGQAASGWSAITAAQALEILRDRTHTQGELAEIYGISRMNINRIKRRIHWKHLEF